MFAAGLRDTRPPDRLIDRLLESSNPKMSSNTPHNTTSGTDDPIPTTPSVSKPEVSLADLFGFMKEAKEENKQRFDQLDKCINSFGQRQDAVEVRATKIEKNVSTLHRMSQEQATTISRIDQDVNALKDVIKKLQTSNSIVPPPSSTLLNSTNLIFDHTTTPCPPTNVTMPSILSSSMNQSERLFDIVSEFTGKRQNLHPEKFLSQLDQYFQYYCLSNEQRIELFQRRLAGNAHVWFDSLMPIPSLYDELKSLFRQQFWSAATQRKIRNEIFQPYQYRSASGIASHAMSWIAKAKYLSPPMNQFDLVGIIIQHYPSALGMAIRGRGPQTTNELLTILTEIEESTSFCDMPHSRQTNDRPPQFDRNNEQRPRNFQGRRDFQRYSNERNDHQTGTNRGGQSSNRPLNETPINQINVSGNADEARV